MEPLYYYIVNERYNELGYEEREFLFLVDRRKRKDAWWTNRKEDAMVFYKLNAAKKQASKLKFGDINVVDEVEAIKMEEKNMELDDENCDDTLDHLLDAGTRD